MSICNNNTDGYVSAENMHTDQEEYIGDLTGLDGKGAPPETEKKLRREIANSNERRRMQNINWGFQSLKTLLPRQDGEKLSKAAILVQTSEYISRLEEEKARLLRQNAHLTRVLRERRRDSDASDTSPPPKRKKRDTESSDEGIGLAGGEPDEWSLEDTRREMAELRAQLDRERQLRVQLEGQTRCLESRMNGAAATAAATATAATAAQRPVDAPATSGDVVRPAIRADPCERLADPFYSADRGGVAADRPTESFRPDERGASRRVAAASSSSSSSSSLVFDSSTSRRNLNTIVEAIRQVEGLQGRPDFGWGGAGRREGGIDVAAVAAAAARFDGFAPSRLCPADLSQQMLGRPAVIVQNT